MIEEKKDGDTTGFSLFMVEDVSTFILEFFLFGSLMKRVSVTQNRLFF